MLGRQTLARKGGRAGKKRKVLVIDKLDWRDERK